MAQRNYRLRRAVFTLNNPFPSTLEEIKKLTYVRYGCVGKEVGASGTPHLQGALTFKDKVSFNKLRTDLYHAHIEAMKGSVKQAADYCKKDGNFEEWGEIPVPGKRNDLLTAVQHLKAGNSLSSLADDDNNAICLVKYSKGLSILQDTLLNSEPLRQKKVVWISGPTGVGKTRAAVEFAEKHNLDYWISNENLKWFDKYHGQKIAIIDDFRWKDCTFKMLLRLLDRYELQVPVKGGFVRWNPQIIFVTTPKTVNETFVTEWRNENSEDLQQVRRRVHFNLTFPRDKNALAWPMLDSLFQEQQVEVESQPAGLPPVEEEAVDEGDDADKTFFNGHNVTLDYSSEEERAPDAQPASKEFADVFPDTEDYEECHFCNLPIDLCPCLN